MFTYGLRSIPAGTGDGGTAVVAASCLLENCSQGDAQIQCGHRLIAGSHDDGAGKTFTEILDKLAGIEGRRALLFQVSIRLHVSVLIRLWKDNRIPVSCFLSFHVL